MILARAAFMHHDGKRVCNSAFKHYAAIKGFITSLKYQQFLLHGPLRPTGSYLIIQQNLVV